MGDELVTTGVQCATARSYSSSQCQYLKFCELLRLGPVPASEKTILCYTAWLHKKGLKYSSVNSHLSAIRNLHVINGYQANIRSERVKLALRSIWLKSPPPVQKKPIDFSLLKQLWPLILKGKDTYLWQALISLAFFAGLRGSEYLVNSRTGSGPMLQCISFANAGTSLSFKVSKSKTKVHGFKTVLGCSGHPICALCTMKKYIRIRSVCTQLTDSSWLFETAGGTPITKASADTYIKSICKAIGLAPHDYSTHSLRAGAATTAAQAGCKEYQVKSIGGWSSEVYNNYVRNKDNFTREWPKIAVRANKD